MKIGKGVGEIDALWLLYVILCVCLCVCVDTVLGQKFVNTKVLRAPSPKKLSLYTPPPPEMPPRRPPLQEISGNSRTGRKLTPTQRIAIIAKSEAGCTTKELTREFRVTRQCIYATLRRWATHHTVKDLPRSGRPSILSKREISMLWRQVRKAPKIQYRDRLAEVPITRVSRWTALRRLRERGIRHWRCKRRPMLLHRNARQRFIWQKQWRRFDWAHSHTRFSDEASVEMGKGADSEWAFGYTHERWDHNKITEQRLHKAPAAMLTASIWLDARARVRRSPLVILKRDPQSRNNRYSVVSYCDALRTALLPNYHGGEHFIIDNAPIHTARYTRRWLQDHHIQFTFLPPYSPDLNPIEHCWHKLKKVLLEMYPEFRTTGYALENWARFCRALKRAWRAIPESYLKRLILSMPRRLRAVRLARGYQTKY